MSSSMCMRCLRRSINGTEATNASQAQRSAFSTSSSLLANPPKKKAVTAKPTSRQGRTLRLSKNKRVSTTRPPAVGERKALRKRVILSNTNAVEVQGLQDLTTGNVSAEQLGKLKGQVLGFQDATIDTLRALEAFKPTQGWSLFRRPASLIREETVDLAAALDYVAAQGQKGEIVRKVLFGERDSGKSVLQLQAMAMASLRKWIVLHMPEAKDLVNAHTSYEPITTAEGTRYIQPHFTAKLLENIGKANREILASLRLSQEHKLPIPVQSNISLDRFVELGAKDPELAVPVWDALWVELRTPSSTEGEGLQRPPILFSLDGLHHIMRASAYLDAEAQPIHAHDLALVQQFIHFFHQAKSPHLLPNGGMILAATSESDRAAAPTLDYCLTERYPEERKQQKFRFDEYFPYDERVLSTMKGKNAIKVRGLSKAEARGVMEYYARSGMLRSAVTDGLVSEKWTLAGGGIIGQIEKASVTTRF